MREKIVVGVVSLIGISVIGLVGLLMSVSPIQVKYQVFKVQLNEPLSENPEAYVKANEKVLKECKVILDQVDSSIIAVYPAYVEYQGEKYEFQIMVEDNKNPVISLKDGKSVIKCFNGSSYLAKDLVDVKDDTQTKVYFMEISGGEQYESLTFEKTGYYDYFIYAEDESHNLSRVRVRFEVDHDLAGPVFSGVTPKTLKVGETFDPMDGVMAVDNADGDLTNQIIISGSVNTDKEGVYYLTYTVTDSNGNTTVQDREITVAHSGQMGQVDVAGGQFLTDDQISMRDAIVTTLLENDLDFFDDETFIRELNDYLINHFNPSSDDQTSYAVIVKQRGNRAGMARAVKIFLDQRGIENCIVFGDNEGMVWNIVKVNGVYRHIDVYANAVGANQNICLLMKTSELDKAHSYLQNKYPNCD